MHTIHNLDYGKITWYNLITSSWWKISLLGIINYDPGHKVTKPTYIKTKILYTFWKLNKVANNICNSQPQSPFIYPTTPLD